jgi:GH15 family glucan-1,4-alpha-glucosidase
VARRAILSNGRLCVGLDEKGLVNDFYYSHVGQHNMTSARSVNHKIGIWVDGVFSWLDGHGWQHSVQLDDNTMMARSYFYNESMGVSLSLRDFVDSHIDFFGRVVIVENHTDRDRDVKLYFGQVFQISKAGRGDTALYTPASHPYILTYNGNISFVASLRTQDGEPFDQFAVGNYGIEGKSGTYRDAEDNHLSGNLVEHGGVDSVIQTCFTIKPKGAYHVDYWVAASDKNYNSASETHRVLAKNGLYHYLNSTNLYWKKWLERSASFINSLDVKYQPLAKKSLFTIKAHCDSRGGVIASADSSIYNYGRDYYNYVWPRDAYYALSPLLALGYTEEVKTYLGFMCEVIHKRGYVHHKYLPDESQ